jgi:hypothetical protein|tara:strand:- start:490 stop:891 length:402 start_codon:yes stop_codon:yes gene_type:complete
MPQESNGPEQRRIISKTLEDVLGIQSDHDQKIRVKIVSRTDVGLLQKMLEFFDDDGERAIEIVNFQGCRKIITYLERLDYPYLFENNYRNITTALTLQEVETFSDPSIAYAMGIANIFYRSTFNDYTDKPGYL